MVKKTTLAPTNTAKDAQNIRSLLPLPQRSRQETPKNRPIEASKASKLTIILFCLMVLLPTLIAGSYLWFFSKNHWVSRMSFALEKGPNTQAIPSIDTLSFFAPMSRSNSTETALLIAYLSSQNLVNAVDDTLNLAEIWAQENDPVFSFHAPGSIEALTEYWSRMVNIHENLKTGLLSIEVRAFSADDAKNIAEAVAKNSVDMVNQLARKTQLEAVKFANQELSHAEERLSDARVALTAFRAESGLVDPESDVISETSVLSTLQSQLAETLVELSYLETNNSQLNDHSKELRDARLKSIREKSAALRHAIKKERSGFGSGEIQNYPEKLSVYERLSAELEFARSAWAVAKGNYEIARADATHQRFYLAKFADPTLAEEPIYPKKLGLFLLSVLGAFLLWSVVTLGLSAIRDRV